MTTDVVIREFERELDVQLTREQVQESAEIAADKQAEVDRLEVEKKAAADGFKGQIQAAETEKRKRLREVSTRSRKALVECEQIVQTSSRTVYTVRTDTGEILNTRPATPDEMQGTLFAVPTTTMADGATIVDPEDVAEVEHHTDG